MSGVKKASRFHPLRARAQYGFDEFDRSQLTVPVVSGLQGGAHVDILADTFGSFVKFLKINLFQPNLWCKMNAL